MRGFALVLVGSEVIPDPAIFYFPAFLAFLASRFSIRVFPAFFLVSFLMS
jgi:hypothetical protein